LITRDPITKFVVPTSDDLADVAIIIPVYNEVDNLDLLQKELTKALTPLNRSYRIVYVNDGSRDGSTDKLTEITENNPNVIVVNFRRNFGQTAAISAGIDYAQARVVILMDADLQNDPADIGRLLNMLEDEGYDVVSGWRKDRKDKFFSRRLPSMMANDLISRVTGVHLHDYGCTLKAYRREVLDEVRLYGEMHRFIPVFASLAGAHIGELVVNHRPRIYGKSKYGILRTFKVVLDLITVKFILSYRTTPMYLFGGFGFALMLLSLVPALIAIARKILLDASLTRTPLPLLAVTMVVLGVQSILMGLLAELLVRTYYESQGKPIYVVQRVLQSERSLADDLAPEPQV
jgi:glycosyltransferase involved in cell wall biosynthesis